MEPKTTGKRIVSPSAYAANVGKIVSLSSLGICSLMAYGISALLTLLMLIELAAPDMPPGDMDAVDKALLRHSIPYLAVSSLLLLAFGVCILRKVTKIDPGIPLTRANTADLPAPESLVRASEEPQQAQEAVLLRAATETVERHEEQLLRAAEGR